MSNKASLPLTEQQNPNTLRIDECDTLEMLRLINEEDRLVPLAVAAELPAIAAAVDATAERLAGGGRLFYVGAGTSGRLGVLDASECPPTYGTDPELVQGLIAGGDRALRCAMEGCEDDADAGATLADEAGVRAGDVVVGITASGTAPFVLGAVRRARELGAVTVALANNRGSALAAACDMAIQPEVGPEVIAGSTRMKCGTAQKLVLNMLSTGVMVRLGKVYDNLMVDMHATNQKLEARALRMVCRVAGCGEAEAAEALRAADMEVKTAILMLGAGCSAGQARARLLQSGGRLKQALAVARETESA